MVLVILKAVYEYSLGLILPENLEPLRNVEAVYLGCFDKAKWFWSSAHGFIFRQTWSRLCWTAGPDGPYHWRIPDGPRDEAIKLGLIKPQGWPCYKPRWMRQGTRRRGPDTRRVRMWHTWGGNSTTLVRKDVAIVLGDHSAYGNWYGRRYDWEGMTKRERARKERHQIKQELRAL